VKKKSVGNSLWEKRLGIFEVLLQWFGKLLFPLERVSILKQENVDVKNKKDFQYLRNQNIIVRKFIYNKHTNNDPHN